MRQKFFTNTIQSKFIKSLVYNTPLPTYETITLNDYIIENNIYIYKKSLIKCTLSGIFGLDAKYKKVGDFEFGLDYLNYTERHHNTANYYNTETHENLGKLLRCYRDIYDIDLLPFYNCFSANYLQTIYLKDNKIFNYYNDLYKVVKVPILYNKEYTIALDSDSPIYICGAILNNKGPLSVYINGETKDLTNILLSIENTFIEFPSTSFKNLINFSIDITNSVNKELLYKYRKNLYLLIQIPKNNNSSLVILEGNYKNNNNNSVYDISVIDKVSVNDLNKLFISDLSLLQMNDGVSYPYADRLIEYLLLNVVTPIDDITKNIKRIEEKFNPKYKKSYGIWDNTYRYKMFTMYLNSHFGKNLDINGFMDKDVENYLDRRL